MRRSPQLQGGLVNALVALACLTAAVPAQAGQAGEARSKRKTEAARFDVASVKPCQDARGGRGSQATPGRLRRGCSTVEELVGTVFAFATPGILPHEAAALVKGGPSWIRSRRWTIEATTEEPSAYEQMSGPLMLNLLKERFRLRVIEQTQALPAYDLVQDQGGARLRPAKAGACFQMGPGIAPPRASGGKAPPPICRLFNPSPAGGVDGYGMSMPDLCLHLSAVLDRDVIDKTGLAGGYDFHLEVASEELSPYRRQSGPKPSDGAVPQANEPGGSVFTAIRKLGLRLKPSTKTAKLIVIDQVELPVEN